MAHTHDILPPQSAHTEHGKLVRLATALSLSVACGLVVLKTVAWYMTDSLSMLTALADSVLDILASAVNFMAVRYAMMPADDDHRFGHGKVEDIAALGQALFISGTALFILLEGLHRIVTPVPVESAPLGIAVMVISMVATLGLVLFQRYVIRKTDSNVVAADAMHYLADILTNGSVIVALVLATQFGLAGADAVIALGIGMYILYGAWTIGYDAFHRLMDQEFSTEERERIEAIILAHPAVKGMHDLRTRRSGGNRFAQFHIELPAHLTLAEAHVISDTIEEQLMQAFPAMDVTVHMDPHMDPA